MKKSLNSIPPAKKKKDEPKKIVVPAKRKGIIEWIKLKKRRLIDEIPTEVKILDAEEAWANEEYYDEEETGVDRGIIGDKVKITPGEEEILSKGGLVGSRGTFELRPSKKFDLQNRQLIFGKDFKKMAEFNFVVRARFRGLKFGRKLIISAEKLATNKEYDAIFSMVKKNNKNSYESFHNRGWRMRHYPYDPEWVVFYKEIKKRKGRGLNKKPEKKKPKKRGFFSKLFSGR